tara:strand:- start:1169 stop:1426 length:258 start_codon:yes stop_codon:yes gene_type:complete
MKSNTSELEELNDKMTSNLMALTSSIYDEYEVTEEIEDLLESISYLQNLMFVSIYNIRKIEVCINKDAETLFNDLFDKEVQYSYE